jgi:hypothetical protein
MKHASLLLAASVIAASVVAAPARAKDVTMTFTDDEQQAYVQALDAAIRSQGLNISHNATALYDKLKAAVEAANAPPKPDPAPDTSKK